MMAGSSAAAFSTQSRKRAILGDSRRSVGFVPEENLVGRANIIFFSIAGGASPLEIWKWPSELRPSRLFTWVR